MSASAWINYKDLPPSAGGFSNLFTDYVTDYPKVHQYFESDFHNIQSFARQIEKQRVIKRDRATLVDVLCAQNMLYGGDQKTMEHIELLRQENTFAVVTGQQVAMLGGPLYTMYKTITAIKLAGKLREAYPESNFVPVFWLEGEDHDLEEVSQVGVLNAEHKLQKIQYLVNGKQSDRNPGAVGEIAFDASLASFFAELTKELPNSEFKQSLLDLLQRSYTTGSSFMGSFAHLLNQFFAGEGLVFISVNEKHLKQLLSPVFQKEVLEFPRVSQLIIEKSAELEIDYHAQIKTKALNLFLFHKGGRYFIEPRESDFSLKGTRHYIQREELLRIAVETPELLSPNVALRPICQDTLLPTVAYVGGPSEVAYFAQLKSVYGYFGLTMPIIYPRASATILEEKNERVFEKYQLGLSEFLHGNDRVHQKVVDMVSEVNIGEMFDDASKRSQEILTEMKFGLNYIDSTLMGPLESTRERFENLFGVLRQKVEEAQKRKHEIALRQVDKTSQFLFPGGNFQERELSAVYFLDRHGLEFTKWVQRELQIDEFKHQILRI